MKDIVNCEINHFTKLLSSYIYWGCKLGFVPSLRTIMMKYIYICIILWPPMRRVDSLEKTLMLEGIGGRRRRGRQRMRWLEGITDSMDMSLGELREFTSGRPMLCYAKSLQSCPTPCDPIDGSPPGSPIPGILQARTLEWVAISSSSAWKWKVVCCNSWGHKESDTTEWLNWTELNIYNIYV